MKCEIMKPLWHKDQRTKLRMETTSSYPETIAQQLAGLSPAKRSLLELRLMRKRIARPAKQVIPRRANRSAAPLSYNQQGLWVLNQLMPGTSLYHTPVAARLTGVLNVIALRKALDSLVARHDALRTTFVTIEGAPSQVVNAEVALDLRLVDLSSKPETEREAAAERILKHEAQQPFDLSQSPLIRSLLVRLNEQDNILLITMHHIVTDGWSIGIFQRELS